MRLKKRKVDYREISRLSIKRDFEIMNKKSNADKNSKNEEKRIFFIPDNSSYFKYRSFILGRLVKIVRPCSFGGYFFEFVFDRDRKALNSFAGWSDNKREYLIEGAKFNDI